MRIAAAADLQPLLPALAKSFQNSTGTPVQVSYASSATLATQILNGAPYDLFLAANSAFPQKVVDAKLSEQRSPVVYARGVLVLWAAHGVTSEPLTMHALTAGSIHRIAVADPHHAPYGAAAIAALRSSGSYAELGPKLVYAENVAQAAQMAQSGNAQCALISKTLAISPVLQQAGSFVEVPASLYPRMLQAAVVLRNAKQQKAAEAFLHYLASTAGRKLLVAGGLDAPASSR
ncbi:MAG TPA: molybdate ABC transporter substrate-binding protein [Acidobacteriaceae bacterium]|nr:molybdate ABC transporter substrate-binding protein [Acidobacteriaceae bacterium]